MPEPFKNYFSRALIAAMGERLAAAEPGFDRAGFAAMAGEGLEALELKARSQQITRALEAHLPADFARACAVCWRRCTPRRRRRTRSPRTRAACAAGR